MIDQVLGFIQRHWEFILMYGLLMQGFSRLRTELQSLQDLIATSHGCTLNEMWRRRHDIMRSSAETELGV